MTIAAASIVSPRIRKPSGAGADLQSGAVSPQPPMFGNAQVVVDGVVDVLWYDGSLVEGILATALDEITDALAADVTTWRGQVVVVTAEANAARMVVNDVYLRDVDAAGGITFAACKLLNSAGWRDLPVSALSPVAGNG